MFRVQRIGEKGDTYLTRVHLTPWKHWPFKNRLYLHIFYRPDEDPWVHDHPFDFGSLVLWGGYTEAIWSKPETQARYNYKIESFENEPFLVRGRRNWFSWKKVKAEHAHTIVKLDRTPTITLVVRGEKIRDWNFWVPGKEAPRAVPWYEYLGIPKEESAYGSATE